MKVLQTKGMGKCTKTTILESSAIWMFSEKGEIEQKGLHVDYLLFSLYCKTSK